MEEHLKFKLVHAFKINPKNAQYQVKITIVKEESLSKEKMLKK